MRKCNTYDCRCKKTHIYRSRRCNNPIPLDGGTDCYGDKLEGRAETCSAATQCTCHDVHNQQSCEHWKSLGYCSNGIYVGFMTENCMTTCGMCPSNKKMPYNLSNLNKLTRLIIRSRWRLVQSKCVHGWQTKPGVQQPCTTWRGSFLHWSSHRRLW